MRGALTPVQLKRWQQLVQLTTIGPCAVCAAKTVRYGPLGQPLCAECQRRRTSGTS